MIVRTGVKSLAIFSGLILKKNFSPFIEYLFVENKEKMTHGPPERLREAYEDSQKNTAFYGADTFRCGCGAQVNTQNSY
jgi:hypothetical protein